LCVEQGLPVNGTKTVESSGSLSQPYRYVGQEFYYTEGDIGFQLLGQHWYDADVGRFVSRDPKPRQGKKQLIGQKHRKIIIYAYSYI